MPWYCIDLLERELGLDIARIKRRALDLVGYLPGARISREAQGQRKRRILVTNAHPTTLAIKRAAVGLAVHFDACYSTHTFDAPKENAAFWRACRPRSPSPWSAPFLR